ncbi:MAG TPA: MarR family winged helix-turn-helix transcriptional regulator [Lachnospiraceae bacterium]|nr:MarR family winged helix-turn-helix transcriptional regulator [Lachnospiraceae bacterium]
MLNNKIYRNTQSYIDKVLKKYRLSSGSYPYLMNLDRNEGISQNRISKEIGNDKAMSARTITKLIELGFVYKKEDVNDSRAYQLYLTEEAKAIIPEIRKELQTLVERITTDLTQEERRITMRSLAKVLMNAQRLGD